MATGKLHEAKPNAIRTVESAMFTLIHVITYNILTYLHFQVKVVSSEPMQFPVSLYFLGESMQLQVNSCNFKNKIA